MPTCDRSAPLIMSLMTEETAQKANAPAVGTGWAGAAMSSQTVGGGDTAVYRSGQGA